MVGGEIVKMAVGFIIFLLRARGDPHFHVGHIKVADIMETSSTLGTIMGCSCAAQRSWERSCFVLFFKVLALNKTFEQLFSLMMVKKK